MARHPLSPRAGRRARNRTYTLLLAGLLIVMVVAFYYGPFGKNEAEPINEAPPPETNTELDEPQVDETIMFTPPDVQPEPVLPEIPPELVPEPAVQPALEPTVEPAVQGNPDATRLIAEATALVSQKPSRIVEARDKFNEALRMPMSAEQQASVKSQLSELSDQWLFSRTVVPGDPLCESYLVKSGDLLAMIGERYKVPYEILMQINNISRPEALQAGETIKVIDGPFHAKVYRSSFTMDLYLQNTYVRSFKVGLGKTGMETPTGLWRVKSGGKLVKPIWTNPLDGKTYHPEDPDYPLGSRWIALEGLAGEAKERTGFAIHGTKEPEQIGSQGSQGCIRMHNGDAILIYNLLVPSFSQVEVAD
ncbi:MAG: L,D-transpeptidase family protein [Phycisphaerales bacterium]|nr:MAG: L,D-transpeptidase family protein [Phycisphaerales bacterium]